MSQKLEKGLPSSSVANYKPISLTFKVFECLVSVHLGQCMECRGVLPTTQFAYKKGLGSCGAILGVAHALQSALEAWEKARIVQVDFSATFDSVNHQGILIKLCSVGVGGCVLSVLTQFSLNGYRMLWWMVGGANWLT